MEFEYEVGQSSVAVEASKMNVFYIGVDNPIAVSAAGVSSNDVRVSCENCTLNKTGDLKYNVTVSRPGMANVVVTAPGLNIKKEFRVKPIPDPVPIISSGKKGGAIGSGEMAANSGLIAKLENFDFDARCNIQSYILVRVPRREDPQQANVSGPSNAEAERYLRMAKPGDLYQYLEIRARCPGDVAARNIGSLSFFVK
jgi:hypothetical protein